MKSHFVTFILPLVQSAQMILLHLLHVCLILVLRGIRMVEGVLGVQSKGLFASFASLNRLCFFINGFHV